MTMFDLEEKLERVERAASIHELALTLLIKSGHITLDEANKAIDLAKIIIDSDDSPIAIEESGDAEG